MKATRLLAHPAMAFVALVVICRVGVPRWEGRGGDKPAVFRWDKEFYPFNSFPMYADPGPEPSEYVIVADGADAPVEIQRITGDTSAKVKKKYIAARNRLADRAGIRKADEAPAEIREAAWAQVVEGLRKSAARRKRRLPDVVRLKIGRIYQEGAGFREEIEFIAEAR